MKILVIGRGGREHAIAWKVAQSPLVETVFVAPGSDAMQSLCTCVNIDEKDNQSLLQFALKEQVDLTIVGPEGTLLNGLTDLFQQHGLSVFGPTRSAAMIEGSKQFAKDLMQKYDIPTARYAAFSDYASAKQYLDEEGVPIVIKYDGLAAGKGVVVAMTMEEADYALRDMLLDAKFGEGKVVMEEFLEGPEFSLLAFVNGAEVVPLVVAQDHKRAFDHDEGPNTGGMGAYSPVDIISQSLIDRSVKTIMQPVAEALLAEGRPFCGVLYGGLMLTASGPKVIEFNARFGDPETEVILPKMKSDMVQHIMDILAHKPTYIQWYEDAFLGVVLASKGYPSKFEKGHPIYGLETVQSLVFHMGTARKEGQWVNSGGRVLFVVGRGKDMAAAQKEAYDNVARIQCENLFYRKDIGYQAIKER